MSNENINPETLEEKEKRANDLMDEVSKEKLARAAKEYNDFVIEWSKRNGTKLFISGDFAGNTIKFKQDIVLV